MAVDGIIFDFDGTIVDTEIADYEAWHAVFQAHGLELDKDLWRQRVGKVVVDEAEDVFHPERYFEKLTGVPLDAHTRQRQYRHYIQLCGEQIVLPGVMDMLKEAKRHGVKLAVASNSDRAWVEHWARHYGVFDYMQCIITRDDVVNPKPAPDMYLMAAQCIGVQPDRCVAIEDSPVGMQAVVAAGIRCIAVPNWLTACLERPAVALTLKSLADLPFDELIRRF